MSGDTTIGAIERLSHMPDRADPQGDRIAGQQFDNVYFTGGYIGPGVTVAGAGGTPGGSTTQLQYNNAGSFGGASGLTWDAPTSRLGVLSLVQATHSVTLGSTTNGYAHYNTTEQAANYERLIVGWSANVAQLIVQNNGTGVARNLVIGTSARRVTFADTASASGSYQFNSIGSSSANAAGLVVSGAYNSTSGVSIATSSSPTINQSGAAGYTALDVNVTETGTGSGEKNLLNLRVGGAVKYSVSNVGLVTIANSTAPAGTPSGGGYLFVEGGALKFKGSGGTVTTIAPA